MEQQPKTAYQSLRRRNQKFVDAYVETGIGAEAARRSGFKGTQPRVAASRLLAMPQIRAAVAERTEEAIKEAGVTNFQTLREIARVAFFDHRKFFDAEGKLRPTHELPDDVAAALAGIDIEERFENTGEGRVHVGTLKKYRAWPKVEALKLLMQYQKLLTDKIEHSGPGGVPLGPPVINIGFANGGPGSDPSA